MGIYEKLLGCFKSFQEKIDFKPDIGIVLGSGLGEYIDEIKVVATLEYKDIEGFPVSTVDMHRGRFVFGTIGDKKVVAMQGRVHYYEGYDMSDVVLPIRLMGLMGIKILLLTNASGGVNYDFSAGDFMLIEDHVSFFVPSSLIGKNLDKLGVRFPDMTKVYDEKLNDSIISAAKKEEIDLKKGVYLQLTGPQFETPKEIKMFRQWGVDATGMSTVCEAIAARHMGIRVSGVSCISNLAAGMTKNQLSAQEVNETTARVSKDFKRLITRSVLNFNIGI